MTVVADNATDTTDDDYYECQSLGDHDDYYHYIPTMTTTMSVPLRRAVCPFGRHASPVHVYTVSFVLA